MFKARDLQLWELLVVLEASLYDCGENISPCPAWEIDSSCLFHVDGDCLLLYCRAVPVSELDRTKAFQSLWA